MDLLVRVVIGVAVIWLTQVILAELAIKEPANKIVFLVVVLLAIVYIISGGFLLR